MPTLNEINSRLTDDKYAILNEEDRAIDTSSRRLESNLFYCVKYLFSKE